jgi:hypothetical protein
VYKITRIQSLYGIFEHKGGDLDMTHYCPGCGHRVLQELVACGEHLLRGVEDLSRLGQHFLRDEERLFRH